MRRCNCCRVQTQASKGSSPLQNIKAIVKARGPLGLYDGLSAAYLRQWTYGLCRMGLYSYLSAQQPQPVPFGKKLGLACFAGCVGAFVGTPSELGLVRMGADSQRPAAERRGYTSIVDCVVRVAKEEGPAVLWRGATATVARAGVLSAFQMGVASEAKQQLPVLVPAVFAGDRPETAVLLMCTSVVSGSLVAVAASNPIDVVRTKALSFCCASTVCLAKTVPFHAVPLSQVKTRVQFAEPGQAGIGHIVSRLVKEEGALAFWRGSLPAFVKLSPYSVISLGLLEWLTTQVTGHGAI
eukprot:SAG22_NODE_222_length_14768_cov_6.358920_4_plen_296_part_00